MPYGQPPPPPDPRHRRPPYPPPQWQPQRPRSGGGAGAIIGGVFGVVALVFVGLVVVGALIKSSRHADPVSPVAIPTFSPFDRPTDSSASPEPAESRSTEPTSSAEPTSDTVPTGRQTLNTSLKNNTLYRTGGLPRVNCPVGSPSVRSGSQLKALIMRTSTCLDRGWSQIMRAQGLSWQRPGYAIASVRGRGACGDYPSAGSNVPYYCPRNLTIYASTTALVKEYGDITDWHGTIVSMMAHEYGHHVQQMSGLSDSWWEQTSRSSSQSGRLALSRRFELQATCFGAMFMRSVSASYPVTPARRNTLYYFYSRVGDWPGHPRDHGSPANNNRWFRQGYEKNKTFQCNTWLAPASTTS
ncbi:MULTISPECIES: neutral zinc metallopeptidase [Streptosporangium]|uniref:Metalloprotease n=1 Tax=Streptosporangium brasiliense TaxID=47480 RepID=A0ABT9QZF1_9ACTN|nr:neutral zinc metallopeptidase [Streptosporangium brasiliense]MDP9862337.1 putative metalloprotease [Streptosporangium brasiliense]